MFSPRRPPPLSRPAARVAGARRGPSPFVTGSGRSQGVEHHLPLRAYLAQPLLRDVELARRRHLLLPHPHPERSGGYRDERRSQRVEARVAEHGERRPRAEARLEGALLPLEDAQGGAHGGVPLARGEASSLANGARGAPAEQLGEERHAQRPGRRLVRPPARARRSRNGARINSSPRPLRSVDGDGRRRRAEACEAASCRARRSEWPSWPAATVRPSGQKRQPGRNRCCGTRRRAPLPGRRPRLARGWQAAGGRRARRRRRSRSSRRSRSRAGARAVEAEMPSRPRRARPPSGSAARDLIEPR
jgi:hypothetical protein